MTVLNLPADVERFLGEEPHAERLTIRFDPITLEDLRRVVASPKATHLRSIYMSGEIGDDGLYVLAEAEKLGGLADLTVWSWFDEITSAGLNSLARRSWRLESLHLSRNKELGDAGLRMLSQASWLDSLRSLELSSIGATADGIEAFFAVAKLPRLERLALGTDQVRASDPEDAIGDRGVVAITSCPLPSLSWLKLSGASITDAGAIAIANWEGFDRIRSLDLFQNRITDTGLDALLTSGHATALEELTIGSNPCGASYWTATDYDGSIAAGGAKDDAALARVRDHVAQKLGRAIRVL